VPRARDSRVPAVMCGGLREDGLEVVLHGVLGEEDPTCEFSGVGPRHEMAKQLALTCAEAECPCEQDHPFGWLGLLDGDGDVPRLRRTQRPRSSPHAGSPTGRPTNAPGPRAVPVDIRLEGQQLRGDVVRTCRIGALPCAGGTSTRRYCGVSGVCPSTSRSSDNNSTTGPSRRASRDRPTTKVFASQRRSAIVTGSTIPTARLSKRGGRSTAGHRGEPVRPGDLPRGARSHDRANSRTIVRVPRKDSAGAAITPSGQPRGVSVVRVRRTLSRAFATSATDSGQTARGGLRGGSRPPRTTPLQ
jgi:hypothetical protein